MKNPWDFRTNREEIEWLNSEVEKLRAVTPESAFEEGFEEGVQHGQAEVERLRAHLKAADREADRLRWSLKNADEDNDVLKAGVERLRAQLQDKQAMYEGQTAEVERLWAALERIEQYGGEYDPAWAVGIARAALAPGVVLQEQQDGSPDSDTASHDHGDGRQEQ